MGLDGYVMACYDCSDDNDGVMKPTPEGYIRYTQDLCKAMYATLFLEKCSNQRSLCFGFEQKCIMSGIRMEFMKYNRSFIFGQSSNN